MPADLPLSSVCGLAFAVKLNERAYQSRVFFRRGAIVAFEGRSRLGGYIGPTSRQERIHSVAEVFRAPLSVGEIRDAFQIAAAAVTRRKGTERSGGFANDVKPRPHFAIV